MAERNRTLVHPNAIAYESDGVDRPLHYFRRWRHLTLAFEDYSVTRSISSLKVDARAADNEFDQLSKKAVEHGFDALTDEQESYQQLTSIQAADEPERLRVQGWARIEDSRRITVLSLRDKRVASEKGEERDQRFERLKVHILSAEEDHQGSLFLWTEDLRKYDAAPDDPDEDYLIAELYVARKKLLQFFQDLKSSEKKPPLTVYAHALLFQDEVEESLSEPWHSQSYILIRDRSAPILVESLNYPVVGTLPAVHVQDDHEDNSITESLTAAQTKSRDELKQRRDEVAKELLGLKRAVWLLAAAIVLAAVIT